MAAVEHFDAVVIGGGLVGTATAYELGRAGVRILLVDRGDVGRATDAGAGILSPETAKRDDAAWVELVLAAGAQHSKRRGRTCRAWLPWPATCATPTIGARSSRPWTGRSICW